MRKPIIIGNWKMNKTVDEAIKFVDSLNEISLNSAIEFGIAAPFTMLPQVAKIAQNIIISAQNCHFAREGAYTGEISVSMLQDINVNYVIIGHSERRKMFSETDEIINLKLQTVTSNKLIAIFCCGETLSEYEAQKTYEVVKTQIQKAFKGLNEQQITNIIIAYEPVWAIGTGKTATPEVAQNVCSKIRLIIKELYNEKIASKIRIQYGGSVTADNIKLILKQNDIDGALVGGASLDLETFKQLIVN